MLMICVFCGRSGRLQQPTDPGHRLHLASPQTAPGGRQHQEVPASDFVRRSMVIGRISPPLNLPRLTVSARFRTIINTLIRIGPAILTFGQLIIVSGGATHIC